MKFVYVSEADVDNQFIAELNVKARLKKAESITAIYSVVKFRDEKL